MTKMLGEKLLFKITWTQIIQIKVNIFMYIQKQSMKPMKSKLCKNRLLSAESHMREEQLQITLMRAGKSTLGCFCYLKIHECHLLVNLSNKLRCSFPLKTKAVTLFATFSK